MKTLDEHNKDFAKNYPKQCTANTPTPNDIACPTCGYELNDATPHITFTSCPPKKLVHCEACDYSGYRVC